LNESSTLPEATILCGETTSQVNAGMLAKLDISSTAPGYFFPAFG
jgi:hypothetical protein